MGLRDFLNRKRKEYKKSSARRRAANKIIKKKADTAYYQEKEKAAIKAAQREARAEFSPGRKDRGGVGGQKVGGFLQNLGGASQAFGFGAAPMQRRTSPKKKSKGKKKSRSSDFGDFDFGF